MNYFITTSIPYANGEPHLGHALEFIYADVLARSARLAHTPVIFSAGTDEHGSKIAEKAQELGITPKELADKNSQKFQDLLRALNISNDRFIRTTDEAHISRVQIAWNNLKEDIYKGSYEGWYCVGHEEYFTDQYVKANNGVCPDHNKPYSKLKEENYFFRLSKYANKIKEAIISKEFLILPDTRRNEILSVINEGLEDISISRPKDKINWGIPIPGDDSQVVYVWFEALLNYITVLGYPEHTDFKEYWPANVQVIGKDILRFHAGVWPGILMGLGLKLPKVLYVHGFITINGKKMSKTLGNYLAPTEILAKYNADVYRYFFMRHMPSYSDGDFSWQRIEEVYNSELANELGNAVSRTVAMIMRYEQGVVGEIPETEHDITAYKQALHECRFDKALEEVWDSVKSLNQYIETQKPWEIAKTDDSVHLREVLAFQVAYLIQIAKQLEPFMPDTANKIKNIFGEGVLKPMEGTLFPKAITPLPSS